MNGKQAKRIRRTAERIMVQWLQTLVSAEEAWKINETNLRKYLPKNTHTYYDGDFKQLPYTYKWFCKRVKQMGLEVTLERINKARR
jgi:hypothetical protein